VKFWRIVKKKKEKLTESDLPTHYIWKLSII